MKPAFRRPPDHRPDFPLLAECRTIERAEFELIRWAEDVIVVVAGEPQVEPLQSLNARCRRLYVDFDSDAGDTVAEAATIAQESDVPEDTLIEKIRSLPPERVMEVEDFVDFLKARDQDRTLTLATSRLSEEAFRKVWDNPDDAEYDRL